MKNVLVLSGSPYKKSNSEIMAQEFAKGATDAENKVEFLSLRGKKIKFCEGCFGCQKQGPCIIHDDANEITEKMKSADVITFATPIYYYGISGYYGISDQLKTMLDRFTALCEGDYRFREIYLLAVTAAETDKQAIKFAEHRISDWIACYEGVKLRDSIFGAGDIRKDAQFLKRVYAMGRQV